VNSDWFDVRVHDVDSAGVVTARGAVDMATHGLLEQALVDGMQAASTSGAEAVVVDLSAVTFMDSAGLSVIVAAHRSAAVPLRLVVDTAAVKRVIELSGLDRILDIHASLGAALTA
jgi:anti-sigma B factor antagonist